MAFEDEAKRLGSNLLYLVSGNLREKSQYLLENMGVRVPYSSYENQWSSLVSQLGLVDSVKKILSQFMQSLNPEVEKALRKAQREPLPQSEVESMQLWYLVEDKTNELNDLGRFLLKYGPDLYYTLGRLSAVNVYQISECLSYLLQSRVSDKLLFDDMSAEKYGDRSILGHLRHLERLLGETRLAGSEYVGLKGLVDDFETECRARQNALLDLKHQQRLMHVLGKVQAVVSQEITNRDFSELRPTSGVLDYQKPPSAVLDGLLGEVASSLSQTVRKDMEESLMCLRFGAPTASVMLGLRAVEGWLRELYRHLTGEETKRGWHELVREIQRLLNERGVAVEPVAGFLNYVRDVRNRADHPGKAFSQVEGEQVFVAATTAVREIEKLR